MMNQQVRLVRGNNQTLETDASSVELFKSMKPNLNSNRLNDILNDIIYIAVKEVYCQAVIYDTKYARFEPVAISNIMVKYVNIFLETKDDNVLKLLYNVLIDTFLNGKEKEDQALRLLFNNIYNKVIGLLP